jgi:hypothetical protein
LTIGATVAAALVAPSAVGASAPPEVQPTGPYELPAATIDALRRRAESLATVDAALATGRSELGVCVDRTGHYFADPDTITDAQLDPLEPESLVYADIDGERRLVAVAWISLAPAQVAGVPMHVDDYLDAWVLHAWVGLDNPAGALADRNPLVGACHASAPTATALPATATPAGTAAPTTQQIGAPGLRSGPPPVTAGAPPTGLFELPSDTIETLNASLAGLDDPALAAAAGWPASGRCVERTGWIFTDPTTIFDGVLDPARPELLIYADVDGAARLAAVGWASSAPARLLGVPLHSEGDVWVLYAWVGLDNPVGMLADRHPAVARCASGLAGIAAVDDPTASDTPGASTPTMATDSTTTTTPVTTTTTPATTSTSAGTTTTTPPTTAAPTTTVAPNGFPFTVSATTIDFGTVPVGTTTGTFINVTNTDAVPHRIAIAHEPTGSRFPVDSNCDGVIAPNVSCRVGYSFAPTEALAPFAATTSFRLACCGGQTRDYTITLRGEAIDPAATPNEPPGPTTPAPAADPGLQPATSTGGWAPIRPPRSTTTRAGLLSPARGYLALLILPWVDSLAASGLRALEAAPSWPSRRRRSE